VKHTRKCAQHGAGEAPAFVIIHESATWSAKVGQAALSYGAGADAGGAALAWSCTCLNSAAARGTNAVVDSRAPRSVEVVHILHEGRNR